MAEDKILDDAAQKLANARSECMRLGVAPADIAKIMLDEAVMGLMVSGYEYSDIQSVLKRYTKRDLPRFYDSLIDAAAGLRSVKPH